MGIFGAPIFNMGYCPVYTPNTMMFGAFSYPQTTYFMPSLFMQYPPRNLFNFNRFQPFNMFQFQPNYTQNIFAGNIFANRNNIFTSQNNFFANRNCNFSIPDPQTVFHTVNSIRTDCNCNVGNSIAQKAASYVGRVNSDAEGNRLFSHGNSRAWCQDFVSRVLEMTNADKFPKSMLSTASPIAFRDEAIRRGCYYKVPASNRAAWASENIHVGDVVVKRGSGQSGLHVAIVKEVKSDGTIVAVSGNSSNSVRISNYNLNKGDVYGIVDVNKLASLA